jgi:hypothetical protein
MQIKLCIFILSLLCLTSCKNNLSEKSQSFTKRAELSIGLDKYVILISPIDQNSHSEALKKATKLARSKGFRYFKILDMKDISISNDGVVMDKTIANQNLKFGYLSKNSIEPAYQITVRLYHKKPFFGNVVDVYRYARYLEINNQ